MEHIADIVVADIVDMKDKQLAVVAAALPSAAVVDNSCQLAVVVHIELADSQMRLLLQEEVVAVHTVEEHHIDNWVDRTCDVL